MHEEPFDPSEHDNFLTGLAVSMIKNMNKFLDCPNCKTDANITWNGSSRIIFCSTCKFGTKQFKEGDKIDLIWNTTVYMKIMNISEEDAEKFVRL